MARPRRIDPLIVERAQALVSAATSVETLRQCQAVLLPALTGSTLEQTAAALGVSRATVSRLQGTFRRSQASEITDTAQRNWGDRRRALLTHEEEEAFLRPWLKSAASGNVVVASPIRAALAQCLGRPVKASVVYRLLARHGWRKVVPDTRHPKSDPEAQEAWKKTSPKYWQPC